MSAFSAKVQDNSFKVVNEINLDEYKTKAVLSMLAALETGKSTLIVLPEKNDKVVKSARNIPNVKTAHVGEINVYDLLRYDTVIIDKGAVDKIQEVYA